MLDGRQVRDRIRSAKLLRSSLEYGIDLLPFTRGEFNVVTIMYNASQLYFSSVFVVPPPPTIGGEQHYVFRSSVGRSVRSSVVR